MHFLSSSNLPWQKIEEELHCEPQMEQPVLSIRRVWGVLGSGYMYWRYFWTLGNAGYYCAPSQHRCTKLCVCLCKRKQGCWFSSFLKMWQTANKQTNEQNPHSSFLPPSEALVKAQPVFESMLLLRELSSFNILCHSVPTDNNGASDRQTQPQN